VGTGFAIGNVDIEPHVAVIGVGGAGCNVVDSIYWDFPSADTVAVNTDKKALLSIRADKKLFICKTVTRGEGTGGDSLLGKRCMQAHKEEITSALMGHDVVFIVAGMGGGTGTGAAPIIAEIAQGLNMIVFSIVINPFGFETARMKTARNGITQIKAVCPMTAVIENDLMVNKMPNATMSEVFTDVNRSIAAFIRRSKTTIVNTFVEQLKHIDEIVKDGSCVPIINPANGLVTNL